MIRRDNAFAQIPEWVLFSPVSANAVRLYAVLWTKADYATHATGSYSPSIRTLAEALGVSANTARRVIAELVDLGALVVTSRKSDDGDNLPNDYLLVSSDPAMHRSDSAPPPPTDGTPPTPTDGTPPTPTGGTLSKPSSNETLPIENVAELRPARDADQHAGALVAEWIDYRTKHLGEPRPPGRVIGHLSRELKTLLAEGQPYADVRAGLQLWDSRGLHPSAIASCVDETRRTGLRTATTRRQQHTDQVVATALAAAQTGAVNPLLSEADRKRAR